MENNLPLKQCLFHIRSNIRHIFWDETIILNLIIRKHQLDFTHDNFEERKQITSVINSHIKNELFKSEEKFQKFISDFKNDIERYEELKDFIRTNEIPHYIKFLTSIGFPFDVDNIDKDNFYQLVSELKQTPEFIEFEIKRKDFIENYIRLLDKVTKAITGVTTEMYVRSEFL